MRIARGVLTTAGVVILLGLSIFSINKLSAESFDNNGFKLPGAPRVFQDISNFEQTSSSPEFPDSLIKLEVHGQTDAQAIEIFNSWDYEDETLGPYTDAEIREDFNAAELYSHNSAEIVVDTINGLPTKVMRMTHLAGQVGVGFEMQADLGRDFDEVYLSFNFKFGKEFNSTEGGKVPGLTGLPRLPWPFVLPVSGHGFWAINVFKPGGRLISYHRDRTKTWFPWSVEEYNHHPIYFANGVWYNITQRLVINDIENGVPVGNGVKELWVDGRMVFRIDFLKMMQDEIPSMKIDALLLSSFYGGSEAEIYSPLTECYTYIDNMKVYIPTDDPITGKNLHNPATIISTPDEITDRRFSYDYLITNEGKLNNQEYNSDYTSCIDETYLIDAGPGNTVTFSLETYNIASKDFLFFYDGNTTDSELLKMIQGYALGSDELISSTGRYLYLRFNTDRVDVARGWEGTISMSSGEQDVESPSTPTGLQASDISVNTLNLSWNSSTDNKAVTGYRIYVGGVLDGTSTSTSYQLTLLTPDTPYTISVSAFDAASNESPKSSTISVRTIASDEEAPSIPAGLNVIGATGNSLTFNWTSSTDNVGVTGYRIFVDGSPVGSSVSNSYTLTGLDANSSYALSVSAFDAVSNESAPSASVIGSTGSPDDEAPTVPTGLSAVNVTSNSIGLIWDSSTDNVLVTGYHVHVNNVEWSTAFTNSFTITQLSPGITYNISVSAFDAFSNESQKSTEISQKTVNPDVTIDPTMPMVKTVGTVKSTYSLSTSSELTSLGHTELQDFGVRYSTDRSSLKDLGTVVYSDRRGDSVAHKERVKDGLLLLYDFSEGSGTQILDRYDTIDPINLSINKQLNTYWLPGQGLEVSSNTLILGEDSPSKLFGDFSSTNEITLEAWIKPASLNQTGPVRILTMSAGSDNRAFSLMQEGNVSDFEYVVRLNTSTNGDNGLPEISTDQDFFTLGLHHVVYTRNKKGEEYIYVNGKERASGERLGDLGYWAEDNRLALANELNEEREWNGTFYLVAIYNKALETLEVKKNYEAGFGEVHYTAKLEPLETNTSYYMSPFVRTDQGIVYGDIEEFMIQNVLHFNDNDSLELAVVPNPSDGSFVLSFVDRSNEESNAIVRIADMSGHIIFTDVINLDGDLTSYEKDYDLSDMMRSGIYTVILILGSSSKAQRLVIYEG